MSLERLPERPHRFALSVCQFPFPPTGLVHRVPLPIWCLCRDSLWFNAHLPACHEAGHIPLSLMAVWDSSLRKAGQCLACFSLLFPAVL